MHGESRRENSKRASGRLEAPAYIHVFVWVFSPAILTCTAAKSRDELSNRPNIRCG